MRRYFVSFRNIGTVCTCTTDCQSSELWQHFRRLKRGEGLLWHWTERNSPPLTAPSSWSQPLWQNSEKSAIGWLKWLSKCFKPGEFSFISAQLLQHPVPGVYVLPSDTSALSEFFLSLQCSYWMLSLFPHFRSMVWTAVCAWWDLPRGHV